MTLTVRRVAVIGGGALGLSCALVLARSGASVLLVDDDRPAASAAAAGMVAPAFESALDGADTALTRFFTQARSLWPDFAREAGVTLYERGADWVGPREALSAALAERGFSFSETALGLHASIDADLDPGAALDALRAGLAGLSGFDVVTARVEALEVDASGVSVRFAGAGRRFDAAVLAAGWSAARVELPPVAAAALDALVPIKGQMAVLEPDGIVLERPLRGQGVYVVPRAGHVLVGATMEPGLNDLSVAPEAVDRLMARASAILPSLEGRSPSRALAGVRGAARDGRPMIGALAGLRLQAALAPRRNGWLIAPLAARMVAENLFPGAGGLDPALASEFSRLADPVRPQPLADG